MMRNGFVVMFLLASLALYGCEDPFGANRSFEIPLTTGMITHVTLPNATTFFGILADDIERSRYEPINLPLLYQKDSLRIKFTGAYYRGIFSFYDWGRAVELYTVEPL